jgi:hypothetical protein
LLGAGTVCIFPDTVFLSSFEQSLSLSQRESIGIYPLSGTPTKKVKSWIEIFEKKYSIIF